MLIPVIVTNCIHLPAFTVARITSLSAVATGTGACWTGAGTADEPATGIGA